MDRTNGTPLATVHSAYLDARGRATSASTLRLRWWARRLPRHTSDQVTQARAKAIREELALRGHQVPA